MGPTPHLRRAEIFHPIAARKPVELGSTIAPRAAAAAAAPAQATPPSRGAEAANRVNQAYAKAPEGERTKAAAEALQRQAEALKDDPEALAELYQGSKETLEKVATDLGRRVAENKDGGLGAALDGMSAVEAFQNGDYVSGAGYGATAVGGAILAAAIPVRGRAAEAHRGSRSHGGAGGRGRRARLPPRRATT